MTMAWGLEARVPFLDHELVELAARIPPELKVAGVTEMTAWRLIEKSANGRPGKVVKVRTYELTPGKAHLYNEGDLHSLRRESETRLIRIEGVDLTTVKRDKFEIAA
jgi:asparagine synthetase B (glutamine-hydrolysing)